MENMIEIDEKKLKAMMTRIIILEKQNTKTKQYNEVEIINKIQKIIEEEVQCF